MTDDPYEAARVSRFMTEGEVGRWKLTRFSVSEREAKLSAVMAVVASSTPEEAKMRLARTVPPGEYISLQRRMTPDEVEDHESGVIVDAEGEPGYAPVMSDTPTEIREHSHAIENAHGKVLITGLGLGVLVSALLAKPNVEKITVVEIDRDVIALTGPYYENNPRVEIVNMDAIAFPDWLRKFAPYSRWDYHWADIWTHISDRNLTDDSLAEHGISYRTMFGAYAPLCARQAAWAYPEAVAMKRVNDREREWAVANAKRLLAADRPGRVEILIESIIREQVIGLPREAPIPEEVRTFFERECDLRGRAQELADSLDLDAIREVINQSHRGTPMARPNEVADANVAR